MLKFENVYRYDNSCNSLNKSLIWLHIHRNDVLQTVVNIIRAKYVLIFGSSLHEKMWHNLIQGGGMRLSATGSVNKNLWRSNNICNRTIKHYWIRASISTDTKEQDSVLLLLLIVMTFDLTQWPSNINLASQASSFESVAFPSFV